MAEMENSSHFGRVSKGKFSPAAGRWLNLYGPLLLALYFVTTVRWGSYLTPGPPYVGDVVLSALIGLRIWTLMRGTAPMPLLSRAIAIPTILLIVLALGTLATGELSITAVRDAAPYLYAVLVLFGQSYQAISARTAELLIYGALVIHAIWYAAVAVFPALLGAPTLGDDSIVLLQPRGDIDGALIGVLAGLSMDRIIAGRTMLVSTAIGGSALTLILTNQSRAGLLASVAVLGFIVFRYAILWASHGWRPAASGGARRLGGEWANCLIALATLVVVTAGVTLASGAAPKAISRTANVVAGSTDPQPDRGRPSGTREGNQRPDGEGGGSEEEGNGGGGVNQPDYSLNNGVGTFAARRDAWEATISWIHDDGARRAVLGVGFGPHYLQLSDSDVLLLGPFADPAVRAVHNMAINTWARLGAAGLILIVAVGLLSVLAGIRLSSREEAPPDLDLFASLLVVAIPTAALVGVVLEAPFGAIPYFWAVGYLSARMVEEGIWRPLLPATGT